MKTKTRFKRRGIKGEGEGFMIMKRECYLRCKNTLIVGGKTSVNGGAFDGMKIHKKKSIQKRVCDGVKKKKT